MSSPPVSLRAYRVTSIDMLRGLVLVIMVLDHVRDYFMSGAVQNPMTDPNVDPALFATRWITHFCAPVFVLLAGTSAGLMAERKTPHELGGFLLKRGLWLIFIEWFVISTAFSFAPLGIPQADGQIYVPLQVIWAIGASMICMSLLSRLSARWVLALGLAILLLYPLAAAASGVGANRVSGGVAATDLLAIIRTVSLTPGMIGPHILAYYAFIPWLSVMCLGFGLGPIYRLDQAERTKRLLPIAIGLLVAFVLVRLLDGYGDPAPWSHQATAVRTFMSFMNVSKYPPSPDYAFATLGVSILLFLALDKLRGPLARVLLAYGRTPLFTYICHIYILHLLMLGAVLALGFPFGTATDVVLSTKVLDNGWGFGLPVVYAVWLTVLILLVPLSMWFAALKARRRDWWLSYL